MDSTSAAASPHDKALRLYEAILTNTPDLAYVFDLNHRFIYANEGLLKMWGKSREEAIGKNCLEQTSSRAAHEPHVENAERGTDQQVLVVDDNEDSAESLAMLLALQGYQTQWVSSGESALESMQSFRPGVVLLDIGMPGLDGYEVARRIRSLPWGDEVVLIALTGWGQPDDKRRALEAGFDHHLTKPVDPGLLSTMMAVERIAAMK